MKINIPENPEWKEHIYPDDFPIQEYLDSLEQKPMAADYEFCKDFPPRLTEKIKFFWANYRKLVPAEERRFSYLGGVRNFKNFENFDMQEFFMATQNRAWIRVHQKMDDKTMWINVITAYVMDSVQLIFKAFYKGLYYQHYYWWFVVDLLDEFCVEPNLIDLVEDDMESGIKRKALENENENTKKTKVTK